MSATGNRPNLDFSDEWVARVEFRVARRNHSHRVEDALFEGGGDELEAVAGDDEVARGKSQRQGL